MSNFTRTILVALILGEEDDAILILNSSDNTLFFFSISAPILRHFGSIFIHIASVRLFCYFCIVNSYLFSLSKVFSRPVAWTFFIVADIFSRSFFLDYQQQMTSDNHCPPVNTRMYNLSCSLYEAQSTILLREWSVFAIIFYSDASPISLLLVYLLISQTKRR